MSRCYVGNIPFDATEQDIRDFFAPRQISKITIVTDRDTGRPRGFAFVDLESAADLKAAIAELNGLAMGGRSIVVNEALAKPRPSGGGRPHGGNGGGYRDDRDDRGGNGGGNRRGRRDDRGDYDD